MELTARRFEAVNAELDRMLTGLMSRLAGLQKEWVGAGGRSFEATKQAWHDDQRTLHRLLAETTAAIRSAGTNYTAADESAATNVGNVYRPGNIQLPLGGPV